MGALEERDCNICGGEPEDNGREPCCTLWRRRAEQAEARLRTEAAAHAMTYEALEAERSRNLDFAARVIGLEP